VSVSARDAVGKVAEHQPLSARVYRTAAGHRLLITGRRYAAKGAEAEALLTEFGADPLCVRLCRLGVFARAAHSAFSSGPPTARDGLRQV